MSSFGTLENGFTIYREDLGGEKRWAAWSEIDTDNPKPPDFAAWHTAWYADKSRATTFKLSGGCDSSDSTIAFFVTAEMFGGSQRWAYSNHPSMFSLAEAWPRAEGCYGWDPTNPKHPDAMKCDLCTMAMSAGLSKVSTGTNMPHANSSPSSFFFDLDGAAAAKPRSRSRSGSRPKSAAGEQPSNAVTCGNLENMFGKELMTKEGVKATAEALAGKQHIMVYFSAHWCPPCRGYTPELSAAYAQSKKQTETAIVFVSSDQDQAAFDDYYEEMSFFALPFSQRAKKDELSSEYGVRGIPTLVLLDGAGKLVQGNMRGQHGKYL